MDFIDHTDLKIVLLELGSMGLMRMVLSGMDMPALQYTALFLCFVVVPAVYIAVQASMRSNRKKRNAYIAVNSVMVALFAMLGIFIGMRVM